MLCEALTGISHLRWPHPVIPSTLERGSLASVLGTMKWSRVESVLSCYLCYAHDVAFYNMTLQKFGFL